jgi:glycosyltransferase involved in cell wall biosynthesis
LRNDPGLLDLLSHTRVPNPLLRRSLKFLQGVVNIAAFTVRFLWSRPDVLHVQQLRLIHAKLPLELWFLSFARTLGCRIVYTVHNLLPHDTGDRHRATYKRLYRSVDALICHSPDIGERLVSDFGVDSAKIWVIPHGPLFVPAVDCKAEGSTGAGSKVSIVLCQGFVKPYKGIEFLVDSWAEFLRTHSVPCARLIVAGSGDPAYLSELRRRVNTLGISESVEMRLRFLDAPELAALYRLADVVVYPYREITTSGALMTGIANQKAIIATDLSPFREVLLNEHNALLVPYGDTQAFADAITRLLGDPDLRARLAAAAAEVSRECSWTQIGNQTRECYSCVLAGLPSRSFVIRRTSDARAGEVVS